MRSRVYSAGSTFTCGAGRDAATNAFKVETGVDTAPILYLSSANLVSGFGKP
jgi:hypothetical protein